MSFRERKISIESVIDDLNERIENLREGAGNSFDMGYLEALMALKEYYTDLAGN